MPDIPQPTGLPPVDPRGERRGQSGPDGRSPGAKRVAESYQYGDRARPLDDSVTIIGIPFGIQAFKLARISLFPFGHEIVKIEPDAPAPAPAAPTNG